jgi:ATP synthase alpha/beta chain, C terminal domain
LLKQPLNSPMAVEEQVISLYAATHGYLDPVPVTEVPRFEDELVEWFRSRQGDVLDAIRTDGDIPDVEALDAAIKDFAEQFSWEQVADEAGPRAAAPSVEDEEPAAASGDGAGEATEAAEEEGG